MEVNLATNRFPGTNTKRSKIVFAIIPIALSLVRLRTQLVKRLGQFPSLIASESPGTLGGRISSWCVLLCFIKLILGNRYGPRVCLRASQGGMHPRFRIANILPHPVLPPTTWGGRILTLHLTYVAGYTGSSSSSNGPTTTPFTTRGFYLSGSVI